MSKVKVENNNLREDYVGGDMDVKMREILKKGDPISEKYEIQEDFKGAYGGALDGMYYDSGGELVLKHGINEPENEKLKVFLVNITDAGYKGMKIFGREVFTSPLKSMDYYAETLTYEDSKKLDEKFSGKKTNEEISIMKNQLKANKSMQFFVDNADKVVGLAEGDEVKIGGKNMRNVTAGEKMKNLREYIRNEHKLLARKEFEKVGKR